MKIKLIPNKSKSWALELAQEIRAYLSKFHEIVKKNAQLTICIGGDGTILYANYFGRLEGVSLGIGTKKSFICQLTNENWKEKILQLIDSEKYEKMSCLETTIEGRKYIAINDFVIHSTNFKIIKIEFSTNQKYSFLGDGLIISSALGSNAYSFSAGGEKFDPKTKIITVVPICPYKRSVQTQNIKPQKIQVKVPKGSALIVDGIKAKKFKEDMDLEILPSIDMLFLEGVGRYE